MSPTGGGVGCACTGVPPVINTRETATPAMTVEKG
jgi:hypothetical protein